MAKGITWTEQDLLSKSFRVDNTGAYVRSVLDALITPVSKNVTEVVVMKPSSIGFTETKIKIPKSKPIGLQAIENVLRAAGIEYETEYQFHPTRKWMFDIAIHSLRTGIEYEGIFSKKSRHTGFKGYTEDSNKYNSAQLLGWKVLRYTAKNYKNFIDDLKQLLTK